MTGDRLWTFSIIFLLERLGGMRLVSINQLFEGISAMIFATYVGNWLDRHNRRFGALTVLAINNICVACSAAFLVICLTLINSPNDDLWYGGWLFAISLVLSIIFCAVSKCASEGQKLVLTKDWIVVMANHDPSGTLSGRNAIMTTIDQISSVIAPIVTGYLLVFGGYRFACILFILWNFVSWIAERHFLLRVYEDVHELAIREKTRTSSDPELREELDVLLGNTTHHLRHNSKGEYKVIVHGYSTSEHQAKKLTVEDCASTILSNDLNRKLVDDDDDDDKKDGTGSNGLNEIYCCTKLCAIWRRMICALAAYRRQRVFAAAFALSLLYMTVLGFDGLAISHGKAQNMPDDVLGVFRSAGSILGILGAFSYTIVERKIGVRKTGFLGLILQQSFLWLCVISIWLPGSPFDLQGYAQSWTFESWLDNSISAFSGNYSSLILSPTIKNASLNSSEQIGELNSASALVAIDWKNWTVDGHSIVAVFVFFCGITFARLGLWMADLSITQIMQESIVEEERNTVFGTQNAFCQLFSVLKDIIVVLIPDHRTFGILIVISMFFVTIGSVFYVYYLIMTSRRERNKRQRKTENTINQNDGQLILGTSDCKNGKVEITIGI